MKKPKPVPSLEVPSLEEANKELQKALEALNRASVVLTKRDDSRRFKVNQCWRALDSITPQ